MTRHAADFRCIRLCLGTHQAELFLFLQRVPPGESGGATRRTAVSFGRRGGKVIRSYNSKSKKAEEFICHEEIEETLRYAAEHKNDVEDMRKILERARDCKGLSYREAALLLECEDESIHQEIFRLAQEIKEKFYGNRVVLFAPLYLSNYCINGCKYCPYHGQNKHISRKKLTQEQIRQEVTALQDMGHKRLAIEAGEDPKNNPIEYILECIDTIYSVKHKNGAIRRVNVNIAATTVENYRKLKDAGIGTTSCSRKHIIKKRMKISIRPVRRAIMLITRKLWTGLWKAVSMM